MFVKLTISKKNNYFKLNMLDKTLNEGHQRTIPPKQF